MRRVEPTAPVSSSVKQGDILLAFDGVEIACDGTVGAYPVRGRHQGDAGFAMPRPSAFMLYASIWR